MTDIVWETNKHTQQRIIADLAKAKKPEAFLGDLPIESVPEYLEYLAVVGRIIAGMAIYAEPDANLRIAERVIEMVESDLEQAKKDVREALAALEKEESTWESSGRGYIDYPEPDQTYGAADG